MTGAALAAVTLAAVILAAVPLNRYRADVAGGGR